MPERWIKRAVDIVVASTALIVGVPVLAIASAAIVLESPGPPLFRQPRIGRARRPIQTLKLRTMRLDTVQAGPQVTAKHDPRITRVGKWLRKAKLDELPQLWNVVRGEMSLVGPRPEVARYVDQYRPEWNKVFAVRPGLTDLASVTFRDEEALLAEARDPERAYVEVILPIKLKLALEGVERSSMYYDLGIMMRTVAAVLTGLNPRQDAVTEARRQIDQLNDRIRV